ncbi:WD40-repeat-containing domain protein [Terfezia claveryi]|nr:WD40-repeat-containing domain protein [Terfezia claveryi]
MPAKEPRFNLPKLEMSPPSMNPWSIEGVTPLRMSPPAMALPDFQPPDFKLPSLSASKYFPPPGLYDEWLPLPPSLMTWGVADPTLLVVGTYASDGGNGNGENLKAAVLFYRVPNTEGEVRGDAAFAPDPTRRKFVPKEVKLIKSIESPFAIFDLSFSPHDPQLMVAVTASGSLFFFKVPPYTDSIKRISIQNPFPEPEAILSVAFSTTDPSIVACSLQSGVIAIIGYSKSPRGVTCEVKQRFQAHQGAARAVKFGVKNGQRLYSGGDDCVLRAWSLSTHYSRSSLAWQEENSHEDLITIIQTWPYYRGGDKDHKRKLLLTGSLDGKMRVFDLSERQRPPPLIQELELCKEGISRLEPLPGFPVFEECENLKDGVFVPDDYGWNIRLDENHSGVVASCLDGQSRVVLQRQKFSSIFITLKDPDVPAEEMSQKMRSETGVEKDWYFREKEFEWYNVAEFREHEGKVTAGCGVALIDLDSLYKVDGRQQKRRGWRIASASYEDRKMCMYQVYVD